MSENPADVSSFPSVLTHSAPSDLILVHGAGGNNAVWRRTLSFLSGEGTAFAINLPGHPTGEITCRTVGEYAEFIHEFIARNGLRRPDICGHSMGGAIALTLALDHPEAVGGLILVSTGAKLGVDPEVLKGLESEPLNVIERTITPYSFYQLDLPMAREARISLSLSNPEVFLSDYLACDSFDVRERLREISARTLIICGEKDHLTEPNWSHYLNANLIFSEAYFVREAGHMVPLEKPALVGQLIQRFLR